MNKVYMFDIDGTLTPSRQRMSEKFAKFFDDWTNKNDYYLVTGSDIEKAQEQIPLAYIDRAYGIFTCCGNEYWQPDPAVHPKHSDLIYSNKFKPPENLLTYLGEELRMSDYHHRAGNHIENRGSMLNFSVVGRNCSKTERADYFEYDNKEGERERISKYIKENWPDLDAAIGGQISIDIYPKGFDKSQILQHIMKRNKAEEYIFMGDRIREGGNDYPLAKLMYETENCSVCDTRNPNTTQNLLEAMND